MSPNRTRYTFYIDPEQLEALRARKVESGVPESEQIRRAIDAALGRDTRKKTAKPARSKCAGKA